MPLVSIAQHAKLHGIIPNKRLGQNFLFDLSLCEKIVKTAGDIKDQIILEVGPGPAGLSRAILSCNPHKLFVIEKDTRCLMLLEEVKTLWKQLEIINTDALKMRLSSLGDNKFIIISNLPYNIGTELVFRWLDELEYVTSMILMLQKEVVDRMCSKHNSKAYGKLSIMCQLVANVEKQFDVSPQAFYPPPKVTSSIVKIVPKDHGLSKNLLEKVGVIVSAAFMQRRKMIKSALKTLTPDIECIIKSADIDPQTRAENISVEGYIRLAKLCHFLN